MKTVGWIVLGVIMACVDTCGGGCTTPADPVPADATQADAMDRTAECTDWCMVIDPDPSTLPAERCQAGTVDACVDECIARMPMGNWCFPP